jgi:hypothetical protein
MIGLITTILLAQISVPSVVVQPSAEERVVFNHNGFTYFVGKQTGQVVVLGTEDQPIPTPPPKPKPDDDTRPVIKQAAWFSLIVDPTSPEQAAWRTDPVIRSLVTDGKVQFRTYASTERDIDTLNLRSEAESGLPVVVIQDKAGKVLQTKKVDSIETLKLIAGGLK